MAAKKKALGKGLGALIPTSVPRTATSTPDPVVVEAPPEPESQPGGSVAEIPVDAIERNPDQPRHIFDEDALEELAASIRSHGVIQPILLTRVGAGRYRIIAGERRWRAAKHAGLERVPALIENFSEREQLEIALIENLQREDLNSMEEARAYQALLERHSLSQSEVSQRVGKARATVANSLRLLRLPPPIQRDIEAGRLSAGHARAILTLPTPEKQRRLHKAILADDLSVRAAEQLARRIADPAERPRPAPEPEADPQIKALEDRLTEALGALTHVKPTAATQGRIEINYTSLDDLDRILGLLNVDLED